MLKMYFRIFFTVVSVCLIYAGSMYYFPQVGEKLDNRLWVSFHADMGQKIKDMFEISRASREALNNKLDNPAPNTAKKIEERSVK